MDEKIYLTQPALPPYEEYIEMIKPLWDTHMLTNMGIYHNRLEKELTAFLKVPYASLMVNGHMALELAIQSMGFPPGGEVITTPFTFISTTHSIIRNDLIPVFCDIKKSDYTIDTDKMEELITERTVAIVAVHVFGNMCNVEAIERIALKYNLKVIYDAAHAFGETYDSQGVGNFGDASIFSFHATKVFHTVEGGAVCTQEKDIYERLYNLKNFGIRGEELVVSIGANAKMNEFSAIMGICNLRHFCQEVTKRKIVADRYIELLKSQKGIFLNNYQNPKVTYNYGYFTIVFDETIFGHTRDEVYQELKQNGIYSRKYFYPLTPDHVCFRNAFQNLYLPVARKLSRQILALPLYGTLEDIQIEKICRIINNLNCSKFN